MYVSYRTFGTALLIVALAAGWNAYRESTRDIAVLRAFDGTGEDVFATLWIVDDDHGFTWVRAGDRGARWLAAVAQEPNVRVRRNGISREYVAHVMDTDLARDTVDPIFRRKYGLADQWRAITRGHDTVPVRLERP